jgi:hypothetical protein
MAVNKNGTLVVMGLSDSYNGGGSGGVPFVPAA